MGVGVVRRSRRAGARGAGRRAGVVAAAAVLAASAAVASTVDAGAGSAAPGGVAYSSKVTLIPTSLLKAQLASVSSNGAVYVFRHRTGALSRLAAGRVMLAQDYAARKVTKVGWSQGKFVVTTTPAAITDVVSTGTLAWNSSIDFAKGFGVGGAAVPAEAVRHADAAGMASSSGSSGAADRSRAELDAKFGLHPLAAGGFTFKGTADTYSYTVSFTPKGSAVAVSIAISKSSPVEVEARITGTLQNLKTAGNISIDKGKLASAKVLANDIKGDFTLFYSAKPISQFGLGNAGGIKITLPGEIAVPFFVGPVPFYLGIKVAFFASAGFSNFDQSLSGSYTFSYDGQGGFSTSKSGATSGAGALKGLAGIVLNAANSVRKGPLSFVFGAQMPQLELGLGVKGLSVAGNLSLVGSTGIATYGPGCDTRQMEILGTAGASAKFFGFSAGLGSATLFDRTIQAAYPQGCGTFP